MREIRKDGGGNPELAQKITEAVKLVRRMNKDQEKILKLKQKEEKLNRRKKIREYRKRVKALPKATRIKANKKKIADELGISDSDFDELNKATEQNQEMIAQLEGNISENQEVLESIQKTGQGAFTVNKPKPGEKFVIEF